MRLISRREDGLFKEISSDNRIKIIKSNLNITDLKEDFEGQAFLDWNIVSGKWDIVNTGAYEESAKSVSINRNGSIFSTGINTNKINWIQLSFDYAAKNVTDKSTIKTKNMFEKKCNSKSFKYCRLSLKLNCNS